jgi:hypothetical protein
LVELADLLIVSFDLLQPRLYITGLSTKTINTKQLFPSSNKRNEKMKKIIFIVGFMTVYFATVCAQKDVMSFYTLKIFDAAAITIFDTAASISFVVLHSEPDYTAWTKKDPYDEISKLFMFNMFKRERISNYYNNGSLLGFSCRYTKIDLPVEMLNTIKKKYGDCVITDVIIFMDINGNAQYYASIKKNKKYIALKISAAGKLSVLKKIMAK